jgi:hypothetical protein
MIEVYGYLAKNTAQISRGRASVRFMHPLHEPGLAPAANE